jgi:hypothetical protein
VRRRGRRISTLLSHLAAVRVICHRGLPSGLDLCTFRHAIEGLALEGVIVHKRGVYGKAFMVYVYYGCISQIRSVRRATGLLGRQSCLLMEVRWRENFDTRSKMLGYTSKGLPIAVVWSQPRNPVSVRGCWDIEITR